MNFFQRQEESRRLSRRLVALFVLAVLAVVAAVNFVVALVLARAEQDDTGYAPTMSEWIGAHPGAVLITTLIVVGIVGLASLYKSLVLGGGGGVVARSLGGVRVSSDT